MPTPCPSCNKFPSLEPGDVEVNDLEINEDGTVTGSVRIALTSACCGDEMREYTFSVEHQVDLEASKFKTYARGGVPGADECVHCGTAHAEGTCCQVALDGLDVEADGTIDETKVKGKKAWELTLEITVSDNSLLEPVSATFKDTVLQADMEEM